MHTIAFMALLDSNEYPYDMREWQNITLTKQTWEEWRVKFLAAHAAKDIRGKTCEDVGQMFGGEDTKQPPPPSWKRDVPITNNMVDTLEGYLDNIAAEAMNVGGGKELADLAASMAILVDTNVAQAKDIKKMREKINALKTTPRRMCKGVGRRRNVTIVKLLDVQILTERGGCFFNPKKKKDGLAWAK